MGVILKCGAVFLHVPKTGGCWVEEALRVTGQWHRHLPHRHADMTGSCTTKNLKSSGPDIGSATAALACRRNRCWRNLPVLLCARSAEMVRIVVAFMESKNWRRWGLQGFANAWHPNSVLNGLGSDDFNQFIRNTVRARPGYVTELFSRYTDERIDFIGRQESLVDDFITVLHELNVTFDEQQVRELAPVNVSKTPKAQRSVEPATS